MNNPITAVWEITMGCNMRCKHCGSSCENALEGELTTKEALNLCGDLGKLGFKWITLSGGEPTTRKDWHLIAKELNKNGIIPNIITNGWLINEEIADMAVEAGINTIAISVDGLLETHDYIRKKGSFKRIMNAFDILKNKKISYSAITTINNINLKELPVLRDILIEKGVKGWQLQLALPMGNMAKISDLVAAPHHVDEIIDFSYKTVKEGSKINIQLADCIGYYNAKEMEVRKKSLGHEYSWTGCGAGKYNLGILHNGDILGCTSVRDRKFIEGNIRKRSVVDIWNDPESFTWNRNLTKNKLDGVCKKCVFGNQCLGGCANTRLTMNKDVFSENQYCSYNVAVTKAKRQLEKIDDFDTLIEKAKKFCENDNFQLAQIVLSKAIEKEPDDLELLKFYGFISFMLENYEDAKTVNGKVLKKAPDDAYANKGMGLSLWKLKDVEEGIKFLERAISLSDENFTDPYFDLAVLLSQNNRKEEALKVLNEGRKKYKSFVEKSDDFYNYLINNVS
ncbi:radical SAM protein [Herbivorax sp. ANBcel31]|uniref:radical SAM/SPASM domain-containing protein n=1 Tax=Herbivorax sp. ANBcel31 TaxID=3069754 RepID=UPI0027B83C81|nr:radical SAM protein [Herbivorax sp. ANBcel31]MDQ2087807.1 radical SAM protein [Herbivorax sp. ANBcel31]